VSEHLGEHLVNFWVVVSHRWIDDPLTPWRVGIVFTHVVRMGLA
jgi:hypothetical protein